MTRMKVPTSEWRITDINADYKVSLSAHLHPTPRPWPPPFPPALPPALSPRRFPPPCSPPPFPPALLSPAPNNALFLRPCPAHARQFCPSYPSRFIVPSSLEDFFLEAVAQFRSRRRIPALAYYHAASRVSRRASRSRAIRHRGADLAPLATAACPRGQSAILRSGQPMVGINRRRCYEDEKLFSAAVRQSPKEAPPIIIDARTKGARPEPITRLVVGAAPGPRGRGTARWTTTVHSSCAFSVLVPRSLVPSRSSGGQQCADARRRL